jgi:hypothetical protein
MFREHLLNTTVNRLIEPLDNQRTESDQTEKGLGLRLRKLRRK